MHRFLYAVIMTVMTTPILATAGVTISIGHPGFYGHIDIVGAPPPLLIYPEPIIIRPAPVAVVRQPIYLRVPPGHAGDWRKHCYRYHACGRPVYFVHDHWYQDIYVPHYHKHKHKNKHKHDDDRDRHHDDKHWKGHKGHGRGPR